MVIKDFRLEDVSAVQIQNVRERNEMSREQFILTAGKILHAATGADNDSYYLAMTGIGKKSWNKLHFYQRYSIKQLFPDFDTFSKVFL
jgi:20S proteasome alpha/beta subunit